MTDDKHVLRKTLRRARGDLPPMARLQAANQLGQQFRAAGLDRIDGPVAGYWAVAGELALHAVQTALGAGQQWCLPILLDDGALAFAPWRMGQALRNNRFGIPEPDVDAGACLAPSSLALVLLPLVGFDGRGQRLGQGGGWYDRSFAFRQQRPAPPRLVGVAYDFQKADLPAAQDWDVPLDAVLTPGGYQEFPAHRR